MRWLGRLGMATALALPATAPAQTSDPRPAAPAPALVFDHVTVVDVEQGKLVPDQRVVIEGNRIQAMGAGRGVPIPKGARVVDAQGKYLIPGLWEFHTHPRRLAHLFYPLFIANGVTGIRDAWSEIPLDTLTRWRQEILAGTRVGPPRQLLSGSAIAEQQGCTKRGKGHICVKAGDTADIQHVIDSLKAAGASVIKTYPFSPALAAAARRAGLPFGGHAQGDSPFMLADSGMTFIDHPYSGEMDELCVGPKASVAQCQPVAERFRKTNSWFVPTLTRLATCCVQDGAHVQEIRERFVQRTAELWVDSLPAGNWLRAMGTTSASPATVRDTLGYMHVAQEVGLPILAGTDAGMPALRDITPGFALHADLAMYVAEGLTPLAALQTATLNAAKMLHGTDSLGTVAAGKLADLVLLDGNPLDDITNTTAIRAVVANGRYYDRAALDGLLADVRTQVTQGFTYWGDTATKTLEDLGLGR